MKGTATAGNPAYASTAPVPVDSGRAGPDEPKQRASALAWYGLVVLLLTTLFAFVVRQMLPLIAPSLQASLGVTDLQIGMLQGLGMAVFATVASYPMGWLADRFGRRLILAVGVACWSLATALFAFQESFGGLLAGTIGIAIGEAGLAPIIFAMIPDLFPERQRNSANFIFYGASMLGAGLGMALGGALLAGLAGAQGDFPVWLARVEVWRIAMVAIALPGPLFVLLVMTIPLGRGAPQSAGVGSGDAAMQDFLPYASRHKRALGCVFGSIFAMAVAMQSSVIWFPTALPRAFGIDPAAVGIGLGGAIMIATVAGIVLAPLLLKLRGRSEDDEPVRVAGLFVALTPLPALCLPFIGSAFQAYVIASLLGALGVAASALMPTVMQNLAPPLLRSRVMALLGVVNGLAVAVSPLAIGLLSSLLSGPRGMLHAIAIVTVPALVASAVLMWLAPRPYAATVRAIRSPVVE